MSNSFARLAIHRRAGFGVNSKDVQGAAWQETKRFDERFLVLPNQTFGILAPC
jgi:hypothetical protein